MNDHSFPAATSLRGVTIHPSLYPKSRKKSGIAAFHRLRGGMWRRLGMIGYIADVVVVVVMHQPPAGRPGRSFAKAIAPLQFPLGNRGVVCVERKWRHSQC